jgi:hypothetical protein
MNLSEMSDKLTHCHNSSHSRPEMSLNFQTLRWWLMAFNLR